MNLQAFLNPVKPENKKIVVSKRFIQDGKPVEWEIKPITQEENNVLMKKYTKKDKKTQQEVFNRTDYVAALTASAVVFPDLENADLQSGYGVMGAGNLLQKMLLVGEYGLLVQEVQELSGLDEDINEDIEEAKNL